MNLSDRDMLTDLLFDKKYISTGYHQALLESADDRVRNTLMQIHNDELASHKMVFDIMNSRGYYRVQPAVQTASSQQAGMQGFPYGQAGQGMAPGAMGSTAGMGQGIGAGYTGMNSHQYGAQNQQAVHPPYGNIPGSSQ